MTKANPKKTLMLILAIVSVFAVGFGVFMSSGKALADEITDLQTWETQARELETWNIHYSQAAADLNVLTNLIDGLLTNDNHGNLKPNAAKSYSSEDGGKTWTFVLNDGMTWFDKDGNVKANVVAQDWKTGLEWILNYAKNDSYNVSMPNEMIKGAQEYYEYTKTLTESEGADAAKALTVDGKFSELVGIETPDDKTIVYTLVDQLPYFPSVATYNCLYPLSQAMIDEMGVDGYRDVTWENMWYSGPYTVTYFVNQNEKVLTKSKNYWNDANCKRFDTVTVKMVESIATGYQLFTQGELDHISLDQATTQEIYSRIWLKHVRPSTAIRCTWSTTRTRKTAPRMSTGIPQLPTRTSGRACTMDLT